MEAESPTSVTCEIMAVIAQLHASEVAQKCGHKATAKILVLAPPNAEQSPSQQCKASLFGPANIGFDNKRPEHDEPRSVKH
jgi:hypothetical protein